MVKQLEDEELFYEDRESIVSERVVKSVEKMKSRKNNEIKDRPNVNELCLYDLNYLESE